MCKTFSVQSGQLLFKLLQYRPKPMKDSVMSCCNKIKEEVSSHGIIPFTVFSYFNQTIFKNLANPFLNMTKKNALFSFIKLKCIKNRCYFLLPPDVLYVLSVVFILVFKFVYMLQFLSLCMNYVMQKYNITTFPEHRSTATFDTQKAASCDLIHSISEYML